MITVTSRAAVPQTLPKNKILLSGQEDVVENYLYLQLENVISNFHLFCAYFLASIYEASSSELLGKAWFILYWTSMHPLFFNYLALKCLIVLLVNEINMWHFPRRYVGKLPHILSRTKRRKCTESVWSQTFILKTFHLLHKSKQWFECDEHTKCPSVKSPWFDGLLKENFSYLHF